MKGIGLVFAGGGGKGAYEIGVWKYLHEVGLDQYVRVVSGTSVGALNAALFVGSTYEIAEDLWLNINHDKILTPREITADDVMKWLIASGFSVGGSLAAGLSKVAASTVIGVEKVAQLMLTQVKGDYMFSRDGLVAMILDGVNFNRIQTSHIPCYATCFRRMGLEVERFKLNEYTAHDITTLLLASSAIPVIFPYEEFSGHSYCDGGIPIIGDNVPIQPVYDTGVEYIIVVHLSQETVVDKELYPNAKIVEIIPKMDLGNALKGTLDFSPEGAEYRLNLGYEDAKKIMQPMIDMLIMTAANQQMFKRAQHSMSEFDKRREAILEKETKIKKEMANDGFDDVFGELMKGM